MNNQILQGQLRFNLDNQPKASDLLSQENQDKLNSMTKYIGTLNSPSQDLGITESNSLTKLSGHTYIVKLSNIDKAEVDTTYDISVEIDKYSKQVVRLFCHLFTIEIPKLYQKAGIDL